MSTQKSVRIKEAGGTADRFWYPRFWNGMTLGAWLKVLWKGGFRIAPVRLAMVIIVAMCGVLNSLLAVIQWLIYGRKIAQQKLAAPPVFIIGHWRSGTTLLHEYLIRDAQFTFADTYNCYTPSHFIVSRHFLRPLVAPLMPKRRPVDNMAAGFDRPQEDEFALVAMGVPSPYLYSLFPNNKPPLDKDYLTLRNLTDAQRTAWLDALEIFLKCLTVISPRQIVLKSPPHTARIRTILSRWSNAKFVHIHRDPRALFPSTYNLWMRLAKDEGCQRPSGDGLEESIFETLTEMYEAFEEDRNLLGDGQYCEVSYDELIASPVATLERVYRELNISGFDRAREDLEAFAASQKHYRTNRFDLDATIESAIATRWKTYCEKYGYAGEK